MNRWHFAPFANEMYTVSRLCVRAVRVHGLHWMHQREHGYGFMHSISLFRYYTVCKVHRVCVCAFVCHMQCGTIHSDGASVGTLSVFIVVALFWHPSFGLSLLPFHDSHVGIALYRGYCFVCVCMYMCIYLLLLIHTLQYP